VRRAAADAASTLPPSARAPIAGPLLRDPMRTVRIEALGSMIDVPGIGAETDFQNVVAEYRQAQAYNADRAESWMNLGMLDGRLGNAEAATKALEEAIRRRPEWGSPYVQLADVQRRGGDETAAEATLRRAVSAAPKDADVQAALGLSLVRQKKLADALAPLRAASELAPDVPRHAYVYAIALHDGGDVRGAIDVLRRAHERHPGAQEILVALAQYAAESGDRAAALGWARELASATNDPAARRMVEALERQ
jgi:Tfp pilus assembly protein PilF